MVDHDAGSAISFDHHHFVVPPNFQRTLTRRSQPFRIVALGGVDLLLVGTIASGGSSFTSAR